jgi:hypothetical protein
MVKTEWDEVPRHMSSICRRISLALFRDGLSVCPRVWFIGEIRIKIRENIIKKKRGMDIQGSPNY